MREVCEIGPKNMRKSFRVEDFLVKCVFILPGI